LDDWATNGKADLSNLPGNCTYTNSTPASGKSIQVTITNGVVSGIQFA
jgi:hypothetical protein